MISQSEGFFRLMFSWVLKKGKIRGSQQAAPAHTKPEKKDQKRPNCFVYCWVFVKVKLGAWLPLTCHPTRRIFEKGREIIFGGVTRADRLPPFIVAAEPDVARRTGLPAQKEKQWLDINSSE